MTTYSLLFIDLNENIDKSRQVECSTDEQALKIAAQELGTYCAIQLWHGFRFVGIVESVVDNLSCTDSASLFHLSGEEATGAQTIDLFSRALDENHLLLWKYAVQVVPVSAFERIGGWIKSGHYVIDYKGDAIVVHCGNRPDRRISVQFMVGEPVVYAAVCSAIEPMLLGRVVVSKEQQAAVFERRRLRDLFKDDDKF